MPQAMPEIIPIPGLGDKIPRQPVRRLPGHPRPHRIDRRKLGGQHDVIYLVKHFVQLAHHHRPGNVGTIPPDPRPHIDHDRLPPPDRPIRGHVMRHCPVRPRRYNRIETDPVRPRLPHRHFHPPGHLPLRHPLRDRRAYLLHRQIRCVNRPLQQRQLLRIFHHPLPRRNIRHRHQRHP